MAKSRLFKNDIDMLATNELLEIPLNKLEIALESSFVGRLIEKVKKELKRKLPHLTPYFWVSNEWFCPDGTQGVAIPFYLLNSRLIRLEEEMIGYAEGKDSDWCLKLIRHELGHVVDNAYNLRRCRERSQIFGKSSLPYRCRYTFKEFSKGYVQHLEDGYAQAHPVEDFAETFAVWLDPKSKWRTKYKGWPVYSKLLWIDKKMKELADQQPLCFDEAGEVDNISDLSETLRSHYKNRRRYLGTDKAKFWDKYLTKTFAVAANIQGDYHYSADKFIRKYRKELTRDLAEMQGKYLYQIDRIINEVEKRARVLNLKVGKRGEIDIKKNMRYHLNKGVGQYILEGKNQIPF